MERAVQSSDYKNIYSAVIDTYTNNTVLKNFAEVRKWVEVMQELCLGKELYSRPGIVRRELCLRQGCE